MYGTTVPTLSHDWPMRGRTPATDRARGAAGGFMLADSEVGSTYAAVGQVVLAAVVALCPFDRRSTGSSVTSGCRPRRRAACGRSAGETARREEAALRPSP